MAVVFNLLATQVPAPVVPGAFYAPAISTPHNAPYIPDGSTPDKILPWAKELANRIDEGQRYGHTGGYGILEGLALLDLTANGIPITAGVAALDGLGFLLPLVGTDPRVTAGNPSGIGAFMAVTDGAGIDNYLYAVSASGTLLPTKAVGTLAPPAGAAVYLGRAHMVSGVATLDGSGVLTRGSGGLWERRTADTGIPLDTPPAGIRFLNHSLGDNSLWFWNGSAYIQQPSAAADLSRINLLPANNQTGTSYTLVLSDAGKVIECNNAGAFALTIPANASVPLPVGVRVQVYQMGAGQVTVGITSDTLRAPNGAKTAHQYSVITLWKRAATEWVLSGDSSV